MKLENLIEIISEKEASNIESIFQNLQQIELQSDAESSELIQELLPDMTNPRAGLRRLRTETVGSIVYQKLANHKELMDVVIKYSPTPLNNAVAAGDRRALQLMLQHGMSIDNPDGHLLFTACLYNRTEIAHYLLDNGYPLDRPGAGQPQPLFVAIFSCGKDPRNLEIVCRILKSGININENAYSNIQLYDPDNFNKIFVPKTCHGFSPTRYVLECIAATKGVQQQARQFKTFEEILGLLLEMGGVP